MDLERLQEFVLIYQKKSLTAAARTLGISTATLSARLLRLEAQLGVSLFERLPGELRLTQRGQQLLPAAQALSESCIKLAADLQAAREYSARRLRIAIGGPSIPLHLGPFLDLLSLTFPDMQLELLDDSTLFLEDSLLSGEADLFFAPVPEDYAPPSLKRCLLAPANQYVILSKSHPLSRKPLLSLDDLAGETFILYPPCGEASIRKFQLRNLDRPEFSCQLYDSGTSPFLCKMLVPMGKGILLLPDGTMDLPPNTVQIPLSPLPHPAVSCFFYHQENPSPTVAAFARDFESFVKEGPRHEYHPVV